MGIQGLYAITDNRLIEQGRLIDCVAQAIAGGAALVQYRDKNSDPGQRRENCAALLRLCRQHAVPLIINDAIELARECGAAGVHLGQQDRTVAEARAVLGAKAVIGVSCHNSLEQALAARAAGADYIAFGRFFPSMTKPEAVAVDIDILKRAREIIDLPLVAIGGITPENGAALITAGADALAVVHGVFGQPDIRAAAAAYAALFNT